MRGTSFLRVDRADETGNDRRTSASRVTSLDQSYRGEFPSKIDSGLTTSSKRFRRT